MQTNILWSGIEYHSMENCLVTTSDKGNKIKSTILGYYQNKIYSAQYLIKTNSNWETVFLSLKFSINNKKHNLQLKKDLHNNWFLNNKKKDGFQSCIDVDISITPFTNTLPVNRLQLAENEAQKIKVVYINIFEDEIKAVEQNYKKISSSKYLYQNVPNDFEAEIELDEFGFVINYPTLFTRTASIKIN